ncbi:mitochondrial fission ELM1 family protein [Halothiobacillus sp. DCM-1]|uniref:mitochondrial fission ELM1 family protein n=1 Tax=Halothiobacillus sp. DCM-1 TaxID=3112558 RepID=UPI003243D41B
MTATNGNLPRIWILTHDAVGLRNQALGLAEHIGWPTEQKTVNLTKPWRWLPGHWVPRAHRKLTADSAALTPPWPELIISCGRLGATAALGVKRAARGETFVVHIQNPQLPLHRLDLIAPPAHDGLSGPNVFPTRGALHHVTPAKIAQAIDEQTTIHPELPRITAQQPIIGVLIGGSNATATLTPAKSQQLIQTLIALAEHHQAHLWLTASRRTGEANLAALRAALAGTRHWLWDNHGANPYHAILGVADYLIVTGDSVSMVSEAASTGKPVYTLDFDHYSGRLQQFHQRMQEEGVTRPFVGELAQWHYEPVNDTPRIAALVRERYAAHRAALNADRR